MASKEGHLSVIRELLNHQGTLSILHEKDTHNVRNPNLGSLQQLLRIRIHYRDPQQIMPQKTAIY
jgi:hypothetical protein